MNLSTSSSEAGVTPRSYLIAFCVIAALLLSPLAASALFLFQAGELSSATSVARWLVRNDGIYGTALHNNLREISFALYQERKPEILVMSSSRGVDFRKEFFRGSFGCACSIMSNIEEGQQFADHISSFPKVVIFGLDYWWFSKTDDHDTVPWKGLGAQPAVNIIRQRLRALGARSVPAGPHTATRERPFGLTRRECEVLELICAEHTNAEIAAKLFISAKTVDHHVSAILAKLDVPTRAAARQAARFRLADAGQ